MATTSKAKKKTVRLASGLKRVRQGNDDFERDFWSGRSLTELYQASGAKTATSPLERIFASGMREFMKLRERRLDAGAQLLLGELFAPGLDGRGEHAAGGHQLDDVGAGLDLLAGGPAHLVGTIGLASELPSVPARHADQFSTHEHPRPGDQSGLNRLLQTKVDPVPAAHVAHRGDPGHQRLPGESGRLECRRRMGFPQAACHGVGAS